MVSSYLRMRCPVEEAMARYGRWIGVPELGPPRLVRERDKIDLALADGNWLGLAVYIYASDSWTVFEELSGGLATRSAEGWLALAEGGDLVYAGYNDSDRLRRARRGGEGRGSCGNFWTTSRSRVRTWTSDGCPRKRGSPLRIG